MSDDIDLRIEALLKAPARPSDEAFVARVRGAVELEARLAAARSAAWRRFAAEMAAAAAAIAAFWLLASATPPDSDRIVPLLSPAMAGVMLLALWVAVSVRPSGRSLFGT
jgi:negative regulator of sigma E activity